MKNINKFICFMLFSVTAIGYSQNASILSDELYLKYEATYVNYLEKVSPTLSELDKITQEFSSKFKDKAALSFRKSKDPLKWLRKNIDKTSFGNVEEAILLYTTIKKHEDLQDEASVEMKVAYDELRKKYERELIYETLKSRLKKE